MSNVCIGFLLDEVDFDDAHAQQGKVLGVVGFDDAVDRDWMQKELMILHNLCLLCRL